MRRILVAEDDRVTLYHLQAMLSAGGFAVVSAADGHQALAALQAPDAPALVLLDWQMPGPDGLELTRGLRKKSTDTPPYVLLLTARDDPSDVVTGLQAGANDYLRKPFHRAELMARVNVGARFLDLQDRLAERVGALETALTEVQRLLDLLPVCAWCGKVRDGEDYWLLVEDYLRCRMGVKITHGMCPDCLALEAGTPLPVPHPAARMVNPCMISRPVANQP